jgi:hypothetical protein
MIFYRIENIHHLFIGTYFGENDTLQLHDAYAFGFYLTKNPCLIILS